MTMAEQILETLQELDPAQQAEVLDFAAFLRQRAKATQESPTVEPPPLPVLGGRVPPGWKDALYEPR
ncbi:MAG: DUF2281 domain-containing protein [Chromatiaceae bacterium]|nr:DUF2281 domain-containing protein [Chromatiaceae bacterium]